MGRDRPVRFTGTDEERDANRASHYFIGCGDECFLDTRCADCDCKPWHIAADYPCGIEPPRETVEVNTEGAASWS